MSEIIEAKLAPHVRKIAELAEDAGLDFYPVEFILVSSEEMSALAAFGGFPQRYPHYSFGQEYESVQQRYRWGRSRIYEMVINSDPSYAYLMEGNLDIDQKLVMAHVYGHVDFFKNNQWFQHTNRKSVKMMADHAVRVSRIIDRVGEEAVEKWIDLCLCVQNFIDPYAPYRAGFEDRLAVEDNTGSLPDIRTTEFDPHRFHDDDPDLQAYMNPSSYICEQREAYVAAIRKETKFPPEPERDILGFLIAHGQMKDWQRHILAMIREESYYFYPQGMTKIMNEGWAVTWHTTLMDEYAEGNEAVAYASHHSGVVHWPQSSLNVYALGWKLFQHIKMRWDKGRFGKEWEECTDRVKRKEWDTGAMKGMEKIFEVRRTHNDAQFLQEFIDREFVEEHLMFIYSERRSDGEIVLETNDWRDIRDALVSSITFRGQPVLRVIDGNHDNRRELLIEQAMDLGDSEVHRSSAVDVISALAQMWGRKVLVRTATWSEEASPVHQDELVDFIEAAMHLVD